MQHLLTVKSRGLWAYIVRTGGEVVGIVEQKDASEQQRQIKEINTGILVAGAVDLKRWLGQLSNHNAQGEFYLTDIIAMAWHEGRNTVQLSRSSEVKRVNNRLQACASEAAISARTGGAFLLAGVILSNPMRFDLRGELCHGQDVYIDTNVVIGDDVVVSPYTIIEDASVASHSTLGPFARLRSASVSWRRKDGVHVGNFVEMKHACLGQRIESRPSLATSGAALER